MNTNDAYQNIQYGDTVYSAVIPAEGHARTFVEERVMKVTETQVTTVSQVTRRETRWSKKTRQNIRTSSAGSMPKMLYTVKDAEAAGNI